MVGKRLMRIRKKNSNALRHAPDEFGLAPDAEAE